MRTPILLLTGLFLLGTAAIPADASERRDAAAPPAATAAPADEFSAAKRKKRPRAYNARAQGQIACTRWGCRPIPRGCRIETEYNFWSWNPTGFDAVVCPAR